ncbi:MAG: superoxide dismutase [Ignavibacteria bacterium]|jgi:hypothetical protein
MKIIALEKELGNNTPEDFVQYSEQEARQVWNLYKSQKIREIYFREDQNTAVIILECRDVAEAKEILSSLPFVKNKLISFDIVPLKPYSGFERLFKESG